MQASRDVAPCASKRQAFTLIELLVVSGIITTLMAVLLPAVSAMRRDARALRCQSNVRQLVQGMTSYAGDFRNRFPQNVTSPSPGQYWYDLARVGTYVPLPGTTAPDLEATVWTCPEDDGARRSYSMNFWASSKVDSAAIVPPVAGTFFSAHVKNASKYVLLVESWSHWHSASMGFGSPPTVGSWGAAGKRFGAGGGLPPFTAGRFQTVNCELTFVRHRRAGGTAGKTAPRGRIVVGFADGHVELLPNEYFADYVSGVVTGNALWSPLDLP